MTTEDLKTHSDLGEVTPAMTDAMGLWRGAAGAQTLGWAQVASLFAAMSANRSLYNLDGGGGPLVLAEHMDVFGTAGGSFDLTMPNGLFDNQIVHLITSGATFGTNTVALKDNIAGTIISALRKKTHHLLRWRAESETWTDEERAYDGPTARSGSGSPVGAVAPDFIGQFYVDTVTNDLYRATGEANTAWTQIGSGGGGGDMFTTVDDANTAITIGAAPSTHRRLTSSSAITLTLSATAAIGTKQSFVKKGSGAITVQVTGSSTYKLPGDTAGQTASFGMTGYGYFECVANSGGSAAAWDFIGDSDHDEAIDNPIVGAGNAISDVELKDIAETSPDVGNKTGAASFNYTAGGWQKCATTGNITSVTVTNPPASGKVGSLTLEIHQGGSHTIAWGAAFRFPGGTDYTLTTGAGAIDIFTLITRDGGTTWYVFEAGKGMVA